MLPRHLPEVSPMWKGYNAEQRSTLRALLATKGIEPAADKGRPGGRGDALRAGSEGEVVITIADEDAYRAQKKIFGKKFREYKQLDDELASLTATFEALEEKYSRASAEQQPKVAFELLKMYEQVAPLAHQA